MALNTRALALAGALAGTTFFASPAAAAPLPTAGLGAPAAAFGHGRFDHSRFDPASVAADWRCRWGCGGEHHRGYRRNRVDAGDVLIGAAIIGGIAAIASSANRRQRDRDVVIVDRDVRQREYNPRYNERPADYRRDDRRAVPRRSAGTSGLDSAVDQCLTRIERDVRVESVDNVERTGAGWLVSGALFNGSGFQCRIGNNGQIDGIDYSGSFSIAPAAGYGDRAAGQWPDQRYADARLAMGGAARPDTVRAQDPSIQQSAERVPAYPGGPIPGEEIPETIDGDL